MYLDYTNWFTMSNSYLNEINAKQKLLSRDIVTNKEIGKRFNRKKDLIEQVFPSRESNLI